jgi:hypothetical protein
MKRAIFKVEALTFAVVVAAFCGSIVSAQTEATGPPGRQYQRKPTRSWS